MKPRYPWEALTALALVGAVVAYCISYGNSAKIVEITVTGSSTELRMIPVTTVTYVGKTRISTTTYIPHTIYAIRTKEEIFDAEPAIADRLPTGFHGRVQVNGWATSSSRRDITRILR